MARSRTRTGRFTKRRATRQVAVFNTNPAPRRRRAKRRVFARNPAPRRRAVHHRRKRVMRFHRNPSGLGGFGGSMTKLLLPAIAIGAGAVGSELIMGKLPIPASMKTGMMRHVTKAGVSLAVGMAISKFGRMPHIGKAFALGGVAIAAHDAIKDFIVRTQPGLAFGDYGMYMPATRVRRNLGYYNPGQTVDQSQMGMYLDTAPGGIPGGTMGESPTPYGV